MIVNSLSYDFILPLTVKQSGFSIKVLFRPVSSRFDAKYKVLIQGAEYIDALVGNVCIYLEVVLLDLVIFAVVTGTES